MDFSPGNGSTGVTNGTWSVEQANDWYSEQPWICGANFIPSTAINQLEMWQQPTFDPVTITRELGWAAGIGMNTMRVYLHSLAWKQDPDGFRDRVDQYLAIAAGHKIRTIFVLFDDCWNGEVRTGPQPEPRPGVHNSGWVQDPGDSLVPGASGYDELERYVTDMITTFGKDSRVLLWDLYNEPGSGIRGNSSLQLLIRVFQWARAAKPEQPLTSAVWSFDQYTLNAFQLSHSDVITYHDYAAPEWHRGVLWLLKAFGRPVICTEYMARTQDNRITNITPMLKEENTGAINWGLVAGKTNTIYAWKTVIADGSEPAEWFHDLFRKDGTPYRPEETRLIRNLTS